MIGSRTNPDSKLSTRIWRRWRLIIALLLVMISGVVAMIGPADSKPRRLHWTTSNVQGRPEGVTPFRLVPIADLSFREPLDHAILPDQEESLVLERNGRLLRLGKDSGVWYSHEISDLGHPAFSVVAAQDFATSGELFVTVAEPCDKEDPNKDEKWIGRVRRLRLDPKTLARVDSGGILVAEWPMQSIGGHMGGALAFDTNGCLIIGVGDGGDSRGGGPAYELGQNMRDLRAKLLRVDPRNRNVSPSAAPSDNPFIGDPEARPEIFLTGMRNPWKFAVHPSSGAIYVFNVGEDLWETIYRVEAGRNAGWPLYEGSHPFRAGAVDSSPPPRFIMPVIEHSHAECRVIVGGVFYTGRQFESLQGQLIYGDYASGAVFAARLGETPRVLAQSGQPILEISADQYGELLLFSQSGQVFQLAPQESLVERPFPVRLSETGLFASTSQYKLATGVIDYDVNSPLFSDGAVKRRHIALPDDARIGFSVDQPYRFPGGTVLVKTFQVEGKTEHHRLETRLMHFENDQWAAYSYRWNEDQTDAVLVGDSGAEFRYSMCDGSEATWRIPSRTQCMMCHTFGASFVLGANTPQLNRIVEIQGKAINQLEHFERLGLFEKELPKNYNLRGWVKSSAVDSFPRLASPQLKSAPLHGRAIAYLYANCAHCHRYLGGGNSGFLLDWKLDIDEYGLIGKPPVHGALGLEKASLIVPGDPENSVLLERMRRTDAAHMPKIGTSVNDVEGIELIHRWIEAMDSQD